MLMIIRGIGMILASIILVIVIIFSLLVLVLQITNYNPDDVIVLNVDGNTNNSIMIDHTYKMMTYNMGYAGLGAAEDFFMDDGVKSRPDSLNVVMHYYNLIESTLIESEADFMLVQEIDRDSHRSYGMDEYQALRKTFDSQNVVFGYNYKVLFVPVPLPPMGKVEAGQGTFSKYKIDQAVRIALPSEYPWPKTLAMLDRCMVKTEFPVDGSDKKLIVYNAHFSAYDDGTLRAAQMALAKEAVIEAYEAGNYVILGGDWNQTFPDVDVSMFPLYQEGKFYLPYQISDDWTPEGWLWGIDPLTPTYRLNNTAYVKGETQVGIIDGFLVSPNIEIETVKTDDLNFEGSDHNPVTMTFKLK